MEPNVTVTIETYVVYWKFNGKGLSRQKIYTSWDDNLIGNE